MTEKEADSPLHPFECFRIAVRGLTTHKLRTVLTMLGMIMGVGVVIIVVAIGEGATKRVTDAVNSLGTNLLNVTPNRNRLRISTALSRTALAPTGAAANPNPINSLTLQDAKLIAERFATTIDAVTPQIDSELQVRLNGVDTTTEVAGTTLTYPYVKKVEVAQGRFFTQSEVDGSLKVCVLGPSVVEHLTGDVQTNLTGQTIAIQRQNFLVVGALASKGANAGGQE